jgi:hypothetical protein
VEPASTHRFRPCDRHCCSSKSGGCTRRTTSGTWEAPTREHEASVRQEAAHSTEDDTEWDTDSSSDGEIFDSLEKELAGFYVVPCILFCISHRCMDRGSLEEPMDSIVRAATSCCSIRQRQTNKYKCLLIVNLLLWTVRRFSHKTGQRFRISRLASVSLSGSVIISKWTGRTYMDEVLAAYPFLN